MSQTIFKIEYLGRCKKRPKGESALGMVNGEWLVIFPKDVLFEWFGMLENPTQKNTLYQVLGIKQSVSQREIKKAYRQQAKQWHPDYCKEPNTSEQFGRIQSAYEILKNPIVRAKYNAGLELESTVLTTRQDFSDDEWGWRAPLRCGYVLADYRQSGRWQVVEKISGWEDITDTDGRTMVASWIYGHNAPIVEWV